MSSIAQVALGKAAQVAEGLTGDLTGGLAQLHGAKASASEEIKERSPDLTDVLLGAKLLGLVGETLASAKIRLRKASVTGLWTGEHHWIRTLHGRSALLEIHPKVLADEAKKDSVSLLAPGLAMAVGDKRVEALFVFCQSESINPVFTSLPLVWQNAKLVKQAAFFLQPQLDLLESRSADGRLNELSGWLAVDPSAAVEPVALSGPQIGQVHEAIKSQFDAESLDKLLEFELDRRLGDIAEGPFDDALRDVLDRANEEGWISELFAAIWKERKALRDFLDQF